MSYTDKPFSFPQLKGIEAVDTILKEKPNVWCIFARSKNGNLAIHEAEVKGNTITGHDSYWLDLEPSYREAARARGRTHDRDEFSMADRVQAYGFNEEVLGPDKRIVRIRSYPERAITVKLEKSGVHAYVRIQDSLCRLQYIYVQHHFWQVEYIELHGIDSKKRHVSERLKK